MTTLTDRHKYVVHLVRYVNTPEYGPEAYKTSYKYVEFPFGKGEEFTTGKEALNSATDFAISVLDLCSEVAIFKMNGYSGIGNKIKEESTKFNTTLEEVLWQHS